jgi:hypothetical protein
MPTSLQKGGHSLAIKAAVALRRLGQLDDAFTVAETSLRWTLKKKPEGLTYRQLLDLASTAGDQHRFALEERLIRLASARASIEKKETDLFAVQLAKFRQLSRLGQWALADEIWKELQKATEPSPKAVALHHRAVSLLYRGELTEDELSAAEEANRVAGSALGQRNMWLFEVGG